MIKFLKDLVTSVAEPDKASHTKFWSNIGMLAMTIIFVHQGINGTLQDWYVWIYAPTVVAPHLLSDLINFRWGIPLKREKEAEKNKEDSN